jgi:cell division protein FtsQ
MIRKLIYASLWLTVTVGILTLLIAAVGAKNREQCKGYKITLTNSQANFLNENEIAKLLSQYAKGPVKGQSISSIDLRELENALEKNIWIRDAQLYFDNNDMLHVAVAEREPIARVFSVAGNSFYIDSSDRRIPLSDKITVRLPVFTGFPDKKNLSSKDSVLLKGMKRITQYIQADPFWLSQVAQVNITPDQNFEMIPVVGNHLVKLGDAGSVDQKFHRLFVFYKEVLARTGFDRYRIINVAYKGQVVAIRNVEKRGKIDTAQLKLNVEKLLRQSLEAQNDTLVTAKPIVRNAESVIEEEDPKEKITDNKNKEIEKKNPNPLKSFSQSGPAKKVAAKPLSGEQEKKPKAVMPGKNVNAEKNMKRN